MKRTNLALSVLLLLALSASAAFLLLRQLGNITDSPQSGADPATGLVLAAEDGAVEVGITFEGAAELPPRPPDTWGILLSEQDNSYLVGSGPNSVSVTEVDGRWQVIPHHDGPVVEVVVNHDTIFFEDVTDTTAAGQAAISTELNLQQQVRAVRPPASMPTAANFLVWGEQTGDRLVAQVILFRDEGYR